MTKLQNPIKEYKLVNQLTHAQLAEKVGLPEVTIKDLASADREKLLRTQIKTYLLLKEKLNLDLAKNLFVN